MFVAGTLVHTKEGLVPIEKLRVGDLVLTQPEMKGELSYRRVLQTFTSEDREVYRLTYYRDDTENDDKDPEVPEEAVSDLLHPFWEDVVGHLIVTGNHPFWRPDVVGRIGVWVHNAGADEGAVFTRQAQS